ncbi:hypothetical protein ERO13_A13G098700v2 [Gossypium hirsutum]|uniref:Auxin-responsive protein SAUR23-like n=6 Tax=Gossypium TaxID=3633 RepID=A0A2P5XIP9_GOSBA|nr:auxin-responsive protein SAUR23-like [Gossypium hirsutum]XP_017620628.1 auxin-responsive protein SAUR23-like [Gossypium arboreum]KAB2048151.1 hypothetical protein ES319_A13G094300v1 [Gossypium barbadense]TYG85998.1 hypothetical protein ES288_A13G099100v1 [Gossypium darwinii]TYH91215.1 hypothetical protein ES332_A13G101700v1 [Gossypium tomentosum]TYJ00615.1 hypothetical protein E1A91_A13G096900v1 [Gossypium mustelinum]KAG4165563.1 hypothetical protein ERO13_A13G098700v2 [Gossypium hirsutum]
MSFRLPSIVVNAKQVLKAQQAQSSVPKGHIAIYVGEVERKRYIIPVTFLNHPSFVDLLNQAEEEFGFNHPMGGLTIPCKEDTFIDLASRLHALT